MDKLKAVIDIDGTIVHHRKIHSNWSQEKIQDYFERHDLYDYLDSSLTDIMAMKLFYEHFDLYFVSKCYKNHIQSKEAFVERQMKYMGKWWQIDVNYEFIDLGIDYESDYDKEYGIIPGWNTGKGSLSWAHMIIDDSEKNINEADVATKYLINVDAFPCHSFEYETGTTVRATCVLAAWSHFNNNINLL